MTNKRERLRMTIVCRRRFLLQSGRQAETEEYLFVVRGEAAQLSAGGERPALFIGSR